MRQCFPCFTASSLQPLIELGQTAPAPLSHFTHDTTTSVLHVLLDYAFLPASSTVAEFVVKQIMPRHRFKPCVDTALLALAHLVHRRLHVVVNPPFGDTSKHGKTTSVGVKQHFVCLRKVGHQQERSAGRQFDVCHLQSASQPTNKGVFTTPIKLKGFAQVKLQRHKPRAFWRVALLKLPEFGKSIHRAGTTAVAHGTQSLKQRLHPAALAFVAVTICLEPGHKLLFVRVKNTRASAP